MKSNSQNRIGVHDGERGGKIKTLDFTSTSQNFLQFLLPPLSQRSREREREVRERERVFIYNEG